MKAATRLAGTLALLAATAATPALADWEVGDPKDIRIELSGLDLPGEPFRQVSYFHAPSQGVYEYAARSDLIAFGDLRQNDVPYLLVFYQSSPQFGYERLKDGVMAFDFLKRARVVYQGGERSIASHLGSVNYLTFAVTDAATGLDRACAYWAGFFEGNRIVYKGLFCPAKAAVTDDDVRRAVNAVLVKGRG